MSPVTYSDPVEVVPAKDAATCHIVGVNIRTPIDENGQETVTIYWELYGNGAVVETGAHDVPGSRLGDLHPIDPETPTPAQTYREHIKLLAYGVLIADGVIPDGPIS